MTTQAQYKKAASLLTKGDPMDYKSYPDGSLVVIAHDGKKFRFTPEQVKESLPKSEAKTASKSSRSSKAKSATRKKG